MTSLNKFSALLLDIEGTTTSICFVKDVLFPYVTANIGRYAMELYETEEFQADLDAIRHLSLQELNNDSEVVPIPTDDKCAAVNALVHNVKHWVQRDKKLTALKHLQGHMWREAFESQTVKGHLYPDVLPALQRVSNSGCRIYIYSSGSVEAQMLLFGFSEYGDVTQFLSGYYDTNIGLKTEADSYRKIAAEIGVDPYDILFLTDIEREARASAEAGMQVKIVVRDGNAPLTSEAVRDFATITSFAQI